MELNLLFLPLLGGYLFYTRCYITSYDAKRCDGYRLIFHAAGFGLVFLAIARLIVVCFDHLPENRDIATLYTAYLVVGGAVSVLASFAWALVKGLPLTDVKRASGAPKVILGALLATIIVMLCAGIVRSIPQTNREILWFSIFASLFIGAILAAMSLTMFSITRDRVFKVPALSMFLRLSLFALIAAELAFVAINSIDHIRLFWSEVSPYKDSATVAVACALGLVAWGIFNLLLLPEIAVEHVHRKFKSNALERLFYEVAVKQELIQLTLNDGKVYVGWIDWLPLDPRAKDAYVELLPFVSGYRDPKTKKVMFTTYYDEFYERDDFDTRDYTKMFPIANIDSAGRFREDVYLQFQAVGARRGSTKTTRRKKKKKEKTSDETPATPPTGAAA